MMSQIVISCAVHSFLATNQLSISQAKEVGAIPIVTVSSADKAEYCEKLGGKIDNQVLSNKRVRHIVPYVMSLIPLTLDARPVSLDC